MSTFDFNKHLKMAGLAESITFVRRRNTNIKPKAVNFVAFMESYRFVMEDKNRMRLSAIRLNRELAKHAARGEAGVEDFKEKFKEGMEKAKKWLIELYDKVIRFFTETLRYFFSNERKAGKTLAALKKAKNTSKSDISVPVYVIKTAVGAGLGRKGIEYVSNSDDTEEVSGAESYYGYGEKDRKDRATKKLAKTQTQLNGALKTIQNQKEEIKSLNERLAKKEEESEKHRREGITMAVESGWEIGKLKAELDKYKKELEESKSVQETVITAKSIADDIQSAIVKLTRKGFDWDGKASLDTMKSRMEAVKDLIKKVLQEGAAEVSATMNNRDIVAVPKEDYVAIVKSLEFVFRIIHYAPIMKTIQGRIRAFQADLRKLKEEFKKQEEPSEAKTLEYQKDRLVLQFIIGTLNGVIALADKAIGTLIKTSNEVMKNS